jgi:hypothetical protein
LKRVHAYQTELQVLFVANENVAQGGNLAANLLRLLEASHSGPELCAVVEVKRADGTLCFRRLHALDHDV